jgi:hypothetical protein
MENEISFFIFEYYLQLIKYSIFAMIYLISLIVMIHS